jgi:protein SCO1
VSEKRTLQVFLGIVIGGVLIVGSMWLFFFSREIEYPSLPIYGNVPDFTLTERSGAKVRLNDLLGQIWIADFIFTNCAGACPMMSSNMKQMQNLLNDKADVKLVSITMDPLRDTPQVLSEYAKKYGARADQWLFLTGEGAAIQKLTVQGFMLSATAGANPKDDIVHSSRFVLVDRRGRIRGYFDGESPGVMRTLLTAMDALEKERR